MSYFLVDSNLVPGQQITITGDEAKHLLLSRRLKVGEAVSLQDPKGQRHTCLIELANKHVGVVARVGDVIPVPSDYQTEVVLCQALVAEQSLDSIIQKSTELGVHTIKIFKADYTPIKLNVAKLARWQRISLEAAKQCDRRNPAVVEVVTFSPLLADTAQAFTCYLAQDSERRFIDYQKELVRTGAVVLYVGPEGGWSQAEIRHFREARIPSICLGNFTLRADTAAMSGVAQIASFIS